MAASIPVLDPGLQRQLAAGLFNRVWKLLENTDRAPAEAEEMLHAAHASRWHWLQIGDATNAARGEWQIARVYSVLRRIEPALHHAARCLQICEENKIGGFDLAFAHEALARAAALAGAAPRRDHHLQTAHALAAQISDAEDRDWLLQNLRTVSAER